MKSAELGVKYDKLFIQQGLIPRLLAHVADCGSHHRHLWNKTGQRFGKRGGWLLQAPDSHLRSTALAHGFLRRSPRAPLRTVHTYSHKNFTWNYLPHMLTRSFPMTPRGEAQRSRTTNMLRKYLDSEAPCQDATIVKYINSKHRFLNLIASRHDTKRIARLTKSSDAIVETQTLHQHVHMPLRA